MICEVKLCHGFLNSLPAFPSPGAIFLVSPELSHTSSFLALMNRKLCNPNPQTSIIATQHQARLLPLEGGGEKESVWLLIFNSVFQFSVVFIKKTRQEPFGSPQGGVQSEQVCVQH